MDTDYQKGSAWNDSADSGGATHRMDMSDMQDASMDPLGESSADAVSAAAAGTDATVNQGSGAEDYSSSTTGDAPMGSASSDGGAATDSSVAGNTDGDTSGSAMSSAPARSRVPDYALEMVAAGLRQRGHDLSAADLDAALGDAGFTINPDPWHNYQSRPSLAEGAIQQHLAEAAGGFVSAAPAGSIGSMTLPAAQEAAPAGMGDALSQIQADEAQTVSPSGSAEAALPTDHPEPASGLAVWGEPTAAAADLAAGAASGMGDGAASEQPLADASAGMGDGASTAPPATSLGFDAPAASAVEDVPVQPSAFAAREPQPDESSAADQSLSMGDNLPMAAADAAQPMSSAAQPMSGMGPLMSSAAQMLAGTGGTGPMAGEAAATDSDSTVAMPPQPIANTMQMGGNAAPQLAPYIAISNGVEFPLGDKNEILVGREDPVSDIFPDVDLTNFGGEEGGVSRRHARIIRDGDTYLLEDLNSTNYTKLNGVKLIPKIPQAMRDGDHVSFGKVEATFHLYK